MTRDTDPYAHTELRDLVSSQPHPSSSSSSAPTLNPTWVLPASITTIHPQLRDLIVCPRERGRVYYVQGKGVTEMVVDSTGERDGTNNVAGGGWNPKRTYKPFSNLLFTPNCLTTSSTLLACGGQNGELHLTTLPSTTSSSPMISSSSPYRPPTPPGSRRQREESPWSMTMTLPNTSINNSFLLLPAYRGNTPLPTRASSPVTNHYRNGVRNGSYVPDGNASQTGLGIATYPNSVPFGSTDRDDDDGNGREDQDREEEAAAADGDDGGARYLSSGSGSAARFMPWTVRAEPMSHWYTAREDLRRRRRESRTASSDLYAEIYSGEGRDSRIHVAGVGNDGNSGGDTGWTTVLPDSITRGHRDEDDGEDWEGYQTIFPPVATNRSGFSPPPVRYGRRADHTVTNNGGVRLEQTAQGVYQWQVFSGPSTARNPSFLRGGSTTEHWPNWTSTDAHPWRVVAASATNAGRDLLVPPVTATYNPEQARRPVRNRPHSRSTIEYESTRYPIGEDEPRLLVSNNDMSVKLFAIRNAKTTTANPPLRWGEIQNKGPGKKLANIGGTKFQTAVNHASVSPDGTTMLVVGDTNDVFLYEVRSGGREFNKIARYEGSRDAGFSTSWSADGRKFAVASQDGQVTVWDHRSSKPLAKLYTSRSPTRSSTYGVDNLYWGEGSEPGSPTPYVSPTTITPTRPGAPPSTPRGGAGRRDPARVVKFSPAGSGRELLVFSEETDHIHIADARTFDAQITLRVPLKAPGGQTIWGDDPSHVRTASDRGRIGIAGLCFDERGDYLYTGTESSIVEYDLRLETKRGSGYSSVI